MNIAFAGFRHGHIFSLYETARNDKDVNIVGCFEENDAERENVKKTRNIDFTYNTYDELLNDKSVEAVAIGDYYGKRGEMVIEALKHGKHVICDKPICTKLSELSEIEKLSKENNLKVCCMLDLRYMAQTKIAKEIIESGALGKINIASFTGQHCLSYGVRPSWYFEKGKHGGTINDIAIHGIDLVKFITGKSLTKVNCAKVWNAFADKEPNFKDCGQFMIEMGDMSVMADVSYAAPQFDGIMPTYWDFYFWGTKGMLNFNQRENCVKIYKEKEEIIKCEEGKSEYLRDFIKEINGEKTIMDTIGTLDSQRQVLEIQKRADEA